MITVEAPNGEQALPATAGRQPNHNGLIITVEAPNGEQALPATAGRQPYHNGALVRRGARDQRLCHPPDCACVPFVFLSCSFVVRRVS